MNRKPLTTIEVKNLKPDPHKRREILDGGARGLRLIIFQSGHKSWTIRCRRPDGRTCNVTLGVVDLFGSDNSEPVLGAPLTLRGARILTNQLQNLRAKGVDIAKFKLAPQQEQEETRRAIEATKDFLIEHQSSPALLVSSMVYFAAIGDAIKIGLSTKPENRLRDLQNASGKKISLIALLPGGKKLEQDLHRKFHNDRIVGEFFKPENVLAFLHQLTTQMLTEPT